MRRGQLAAVVGLVVLVGALAISSRITAWLRIEWIVLLLLLAHLAWWRAVRLQLRAPAVLMVTALLGSSAMLALPVAEDDHFRYLWDGYITATTGSPYGVAPAAYFGDGSVPAPMQAVLDGVNYPQVATIYGPALQWIFFVSHLLGAANQHWLRAILVLLHLGAVTLALRHLPARRVALIAWNPLLVHAGLMNLHPDFLLGWLLLAASMAARRGYCVASGVLGGLALGVKVTALAVLPLLVLAVSGSRARLSRYRFGIPLRGALLATATSVATFALLYLPFLSSSATEAAGLLVFAAHWQFNPAVFALLDGVLGSDQARPAAAIVVAIGIGLLALQPIVHRRPAMSIAARCVAALGLLLLMSPVINAWYVLWLLPCAALTRWTSPWIAAAALSLTFLTHGQLDLPGHRFELHWLAMLAQWTAIAAALCYDLSRAFARRD